MSTKKTLFFSLAFIFISIGIYASYYKFDLSAFLAIPRYLVVCSNNEFNHVRFFEQGGSDGGYNYIISLDPLMLQRTEFPECTLHGVTYTRDRFLFHLTAWALAAGQKSYVHISLFFLNILSLLGTVFFSYLILKKYNPSSMVLLAAVLTPGLWQTIRFTTIDLFWTMLILAAIYCYQNKRFIYLSLILTLAILTRNLTLLFIGGFIIETFFNKKNRQDFIQQLLPYIPPIVIYFTIFKPWLKKVLSFSPFKFSTVDFFTIPGWSFFEQMEDVLLAKNWIHFVSGSLGYLLIMGMLSSVLYICIKNKKICLYSFATLAFCSLLLVLNNVAWNNALVQLSRVLTPVLICYLIFIKKHASRYTHFVASLILMTSLAAWIWFLFSAKQTLLSHFAKL